MVVVNKFMPVRYKPTNLGGKLHGQNANVTLRRDIQQCLREGMTVAEIADALGRKPACIRGQLERMGVKLR